MKKILFIFDRVMHYHRDLFQTLETRLKDAGMDLHLLSGESNLCATGRVGINDKLIENESKYRFIERKIGRYTLRYNSGVFNILYVLRPDTVVVMGHSGNITHWVLALLKKILGFKLVAWQCGYEYNPTLLKKIILKRFIPCFDHHLAYHSNAYSYALAYGASKNQATIIHNTINEKNISLLPKADALNFLCKLHPEIDKRRIVLFVGALLAEKRIETILAALDLLCRNDIVFVLVGDGEYATELKKVCAERKDVVFAGAVIDGVGIYFDAAEIYLLPGTGGLGINEAMAHSLPIISGYADGSADDLVINGENGFRLKSGTADEMATFINIILDDTELRIRMGNKSRELITNTFTFQRFVDCVANTLVEITK